MGGSGINKGFPSSFVKEGASKGTLNRCQFYKEGIHARDALTTSCSPN